MDAGDRKATCAATSAATSSRSSELETDYRSADLQARPAAGLDGGLPTIGGKTYRFVVNGQHRRGRRASGPTAPVKIAFAVILGLVVALAIAGLMIAQNS